MTPVLADATSDSIDEFQIPKDEIPDWAYELANGENEIRPKAAPQEVERGATTNAVVVDAQSYSISGEIPIKRDTRGFRFFRYCEKASRQEKNPLGIRQKIGKSIRTIKGVSWRLESTSSSITSSMAD